MKSEREQNFRGLPRVTVADKLDTSFVLCKDLSTAT